MFPTCVIFMREVASLSVMFPTGVPLRDDGAILGNASRNRWCLSLFLKAGRAGMDERWTGNLFQKSEAADEKDFDSAIVVLRDGTHIVKEEDDRSDRNRGQVKVTLGKKWHGRFCYSVLKKIWIYGSLNVFEGEKSIFDIISELPCLSDLENPGQLPVQEVLEGTDDCVWWIFEISSPFMFSRAGNPFLIFLLSYHVPVTSKIQVNFRYRRYLKILLIVSYKFLKFSHYSCFRGRGIHFWYCSLATMFGCPRKSRSTSGTGGTDDSVLWIFEISSVFMFSRSRNPLLAFLLSCQVRVTLKIQVNFRSSRVLVVLMILSYGFSEFFY